MRTHLKTWLLITMTLLTTVGLNAQEPYSFHKSGLKLTYVDKNEKGKISGYSEINVTEVEGEPTNCTVTYKTMSLDNKRKPMMENAIDAKVTINNSAVTFDPSSLVGQPLEGMQISGDNLIIPADAAVGDVLDDCILSINMAGIKSTISNSNLKVIGKETLDISGKSIDCLVVESTVSSKVIGITQQSKQKAWYGRGVGSVKTETYNKKGKLTSVHELIEVEGL
ncbi:TapB family protein [Parabacteroides sp.]